MLKEKSTKTQSRKKQTTDVSDALFHVTPQPSIDIFEVLGGAINVQTAAFLTGKTDILDPSRPIQAEQARPAKADAKTDAKTDVKAKPKAYGNEELKYENHSNVEHSAQDAADIVALPKQSEPRVEEKAGKLDKPTLQDASQTLDIPQSKAVDVAIEQDSSIDKMISAQIVTQAPEYTQEPTSTAIKVTLDCSEPTEDVIHAHMNHAHHNEHTLTSPMQQENATIPAANSHHQAHVHAIHDDTSHATSYDNEHSTDTSTAAHERKNSMLHSQADIPPASHHASAHSAHHTSIEDSTTRSIQHSTATNIENSTHIAPTYKESLEHSEGEHDIHAMGSQHYSGHIAEPCATIYSREPQAPVYGAQHHQQAPQGVTLLNQLTKREEELLQFLRHHDGQIVSYSQMLKALNWRESQRCTARNIIARFEANGIIHRQRIQGTRSQGYLFTMCHQEANHTSTQQNMGYVPYQIPPNQAANTAAFAYAIPNTMPLKAPTPSVPQGYHPHVMGAEYSTQTSIGTSSNTVSKHSMPNSIAPSSHPSMPLYIDKIDRLIQSIWQSDQETILACWPAAAAAGLRSAHLRQLESIFDLQGFEVGTVSLALRYLDWQLEQGPLTNARGELIEDPIAYWLSSMRRHGYYSRPKGYVDPLLEAKRLLAEEEQSKAEMQTRLMQARQESEAAQEEQRCELLFGELMQLGVHHSLWPVFYERLPQMFRQKVDLEGPQALAKKFAMVKALVKEL
ncbi:MAG: helix-turn-helix domain-containing protein [Pseudomonadota bacterium]